MYAYTVFYPEQLPPLSRSDHRRFVILPWGMDMSMKPFRDSGKPHIKVFELARRIDQPRQGHRGPHLPALPAKCRLSGRLRGSRRRARPGLRSGRAGGGRPAGLRPDQAARPGGSAQGVHGAADRGRLPVGAAHHSRTARRFAGRSSRRAIGALRFLRLRRGENVNIQSLATMLPVRVLLTGLVLAVCAWGCGGASPGKKNDAAVDSRPPTSPVDSRPPPAPDGAAPDGQANGDAAVDAGQTGDAPRDADGALPTTDAGPRDGGTGDVPDAAPLGSCPLGPPPTAPAVNITALTMALDALDAHLSGASPLTAPQLAQLEVQLRQNAIAVGTSAGLLMRAFAVSRRYETSNGPLFINARTRGGFPRTGGRELDRAMLVLQQLLIDQAFDRQNVERHQQIFAGAGFATSSYFPGAVAAPTDPGVTHSVRINASQPTFVGLPVAYHDLPALRPTGTYLAPGSVAVVTVPDALVGKGFSVRVGAHSWDLRDKPTITRFDRVSIVYPITCKWTRIANPLGGGIYVEVPVPGQRGGRHHSGHQRSSLSLLRRAQLRASHHAGRLGDIGTPANSALGRLRVRQVHDAGADRLAESGYRSGKADGGLGQRDGRFLPAVRRPAGSSQDGAVPPDRHNFSGHGELPRLPAVQLSLRSRTPHRRQRASVDAAGSSAVRLGDPARAGARPSVHQISR